MVEFNRALFHELCLQVEQTGDPKELIELSGEIVRLIDDKRRRITLAQRAAMLIQSGQPRFKLTPRRAA